MPRLSLAVILPVVLVLVVLVLFGQRAGLWGQPDPTQPPSTATADEQRPAAAGGGRARGVAGPAANATLPPAETNPVPAGTPDVRAPPAAAAPATGTPAAPRAGEAAPPAPPRAGN